MLDVTRLYFGPLYRVRVGLSLALGLGLLGPVALNLASALGLAAVPGWILLGAAGAGLTILVMLLAWTRQRVKTLAAAIEGADSSIALYDAQDRLVLANKRYREALDLPDCAFRPGAPYRELIQRSVESHLPADQVQDELEHLISAHRRADGRPLDRRFPNERWERMTKSRLPDGFTLGIAVDVTEYYHLRELIDVEARRFAALARGAPVGICQIDSNRQIQFVNDALLAMMGVADRRALASESLKFSAEGDVIGDFAALTAFLRTRTAETEVSLDHRGEVRFMMVRKAFVPVVGSTARAMGAPEAENLFIFVDITTRIAAETKISYLALHDPLTEALNRVAFAEDLERAAADADAMRPAALIALDLDRFKPVNDVYGHAVGDELLSRVVKRIEAAVPDGCQVYRLGGDEFAVLCPPPLGANALAYAGRIRDRVCDPFTIDGRRIVIGTSVGVSSLPLDTDTAKTMMHYADLALYQAKRNGGCAVQAFSPSVLNNADMHRVMELDLAAAVENGDIEIALQPIFGTDRERPAAAETLARWTNRRTGEVVPPDTFIPVAEAANLIVRLDMMIFHRAIAAYAKMLDDGVALRRLTINVSVRTLMQPDFLNTVKTALAQHHVPGQSVVMEVTENFEVDNFRALGERMQAVRALGLDFALDDFGTGYTSMRMLADLPVRYLKIDRSFIRGLTGTRFNRQHGIVRAMLDLANHLELDVIAEGVETEEQLASLRAMGCTYVQGFLLGKPQTPEALAKAIGAGPRAGWAAA